MLDPRDISPRHSPIQAVILLAVAIAGLLGLALHTTDRLKSAAIAVGQHPPIQSLLGALGAADLAFITLTIVGGLGFVMVEARYGVIRSCFEGAGSVWTIVVTALLLVWLCHASLGRGLIVTGDAGTHVAPVNHLALAIQQHASLFWDNYFFGGSTLLQFTGPVFHWAATAVDLVVGDPTLSIKLTVVASRFVAAVFMFLLCTRFGASRPLACVIALSYAGGYFVTYMASVRSTFPQMVVFATMPAVFLFVDRIVAAPGRSVGAIAGLALTTIVFIGVHQPTVLVFGVYAGLFTIARLWAAGWPRRALRGLVIALALAVIGSAFFVVPFALERGLTAEPRSFASMVDVVWPGMSVLSDIVTWRAFGTGADYSAWFGLVTLVGIIAVLSRRPIEPEDSVQRRLGLLVAGLAVMSLFIWFIYVRQLAFSLFLASFAASLGLTAVMGARPRWRWLPALALLLVMIDLGPLAFQPWTRSDFVPVARAGDHLARLAANERVVEVGTGKGQPLLSVDPSVSPLFYGQVQGLMGPHKPDAPRSHNGAAMALRLAQQDLRATRGLRPEIEATLEVRNVRWLIGLSGPRLGLPSDLPSNQVDPLLGRIWRLEHATPILLSGRIEPAPWPGFSFRNGYWDATLVDTDPDVRQGLRTALANHERMEVQPGSRQAGTFLMPAIPDEPDWRSSGDGATPVSTLLRYEVSPGTVDLSVEADRAGFIRLAHPVALGLVVQVNGRRVTPAPDVDGLIVLPVGAGRSEIHLEWHPSALRRVCFWLTVATTMFLTVVIAWQAIRRFSPSRPSNPSPERT